LFQHPYRLALSLCPLHDLTDLVRADELENGPQLVRSGKDGSFDDIDLEGCGAVVAGDSTAGGVRGCSPEEV